MEVNYQQVVLQYIYEKDSNIPINLWIENSLLIANDPSSGSGFGRTVDISDRFAITGAPTAESVYVFEKDSISGQWNQTAKLQANDSTLYYTFGYSVAIDGNIIVVGSFGDDSIAANGGSAYIFEYNNITNTWYQIRKLVSNTTSFDDYFDWDVAISNDYIMIGAPQDDDGANSTGSVYIYKKLAQSMEIFDEVYNESFIFDDWEFSQRIISTNRSANDFFGAAVSMDVNRAIIGNNAGVANRVWIFELNQTDSSDDQKWFESSSDSLNVVIDGFYALYNATFECDSPLSQCTFMCNASDYNSSCVELFTIDDSCGSNCQIDNRFSILL